MSDEIANLTRYPMHVYDAAFQFGRTHYAWQNDGASDSENVEVIATLERELTEMEAAAEQRGREAERARCVAALTDAYAKLPHKRDEAGTLNHEWTSYDEGREDGMDEAIRIAGGPA